jgi:hypothetical protein
MASKLYESAGAGGATPPPAGPDVEGDTSANGSGRTDGPSKKKSDVIDAEFEETN